MTTLRPTVLVALVSLLAACDNDSTPGEPVAPDDNNFQVRVVAETGTQHGGESADFADADHVTFTEVQADGSLVLLTEAQLDASATAVAEVPVPDTAVMVLVEAWTADDKLVAAALSEQEGFELNDTRQVRLDAETTTEAWVWTDRVARSGDAYASSHVLVRTMIDARLAGVVYEEYASDLSIDEELMALGEATLAAQAAQDASFEAAGATDSAEARYLATVDASQELSAALFSDSADHTAAWEDFYTAIDLRTEQAGLTDTERVDAASATSLAFRASLDSRTDVSADFLSQADRSASIWEAWNVRMALAPLGDSAEGIAQSFWLDARSANGSDAMVQAWNDLASELAVSLPGSGSLPPVVDDYVDDVVNGEIDVLGGTLDEAVDAMVEAFETSGDIQSDGTLAADFWADVRSEVTLIVEEEGTFGPGDTGVATEMLVHASAAHRVLY